MKFKFKPDYKTPLKTCIIPVAAEDLTTKRFKAFLKTEKVDPFMIKSFTAASKEICLLSGERSKYIYLVGMGKKLDYKHIRDSFRQFAIKYSAQLSASMGLRLDVTKWLDAPAGATTLMKAATNGLILGTYDIGLYKTEDKQTHPLQDAQTALTIFAEKDLHVALEYEAREGEALANTQLSIMDLVNAPGNKAIPSVLGEWAINSGKKFGFKTKVLGKAQIVATGLEGLLAVNRGSEYPPVFIIMEYKPKGAGKKQLPKIGIAGKGVTFDTGGISIKGHQNMHYMKSDMGGAAAVLGAMEMTAKLQLPIHLIAIVPATDNCVDANAVKPGDVINSYSGKTIEIIDTDAEGRLILADALAYLNEKYQPEILLDLATLTGSGVRTFGYETGALFSHDEELIDALTTAGRSCSERLWPLPIWEAYGHYMESDVADIKNLSGRPVAGAITAAKFLEFFTDHHPKWAHMDIAGVAFGDTGFSKQKSATGYGVNLLVEFLKSL